MSAARDIVWIASYPKSGNTWVRFMLCNLIFGRQDSAAALNAMAPDIHELGAENLRAHAGLIKTHLCCTPALSLLERTAAAIYVVRQPADVLISNFHYARRSGAAAGASRDELDRYFDAFLQSRGDPRWLQLGMGTWEDNVRSWLDTAHPFRVLAVRYEDLAADPGKSCARMAGFLGLTRAAHDIDAAVANASFQRMREIESADIHARRVGIFYKPYLQGAIDAGLRFMRSGAVGDSARQLTPQQRARLSQTFEPWLSRLGYTGR